MVLGVVHFVRTRLGLAQDEKLRQKLLAAGLRESSDVDTYFGIRLVGPVAAVAAGTFIRSNTIFWIVVLMAAAYLAPDVWVNHRIAPAPRAYTAGPAGRARPDGGLRRCRTGAGPGLAARRSGAGAEPAGDFGRVYPDQLRAACRQAADRGLAKHGRRGQSWTW